MAASLSKRVISQFKRGVKHFLLIRSSSNITRSATTSSYRVEKTSIEEERHETHFGFQSVTEEEKEHKGEITQEASKLKKK